MKTAKRVPVVDAHEEEPDNDDVIETHGRELGSAGKGRDPLPKRLMTSKTANCSLGVVTEPSQAGLTCGLAKPLIRREGKRPVGHPNHTSVSIGRNRAGLDSTGRRSLV